MKRPISVFQFSIQNSGEDSVDINIDADIVDASTQAVLESWFGDTTSTSYKSFRNEVNKLNAKTYNVIINSQGGHVGDALAIHDYIKDLQSKGKIVNTIGRGIVASSATLILLSGDQPEMSANSFFMMHTVSGGIYGTVDQVENYATTMRTFNNTIRDLYASKSGMRAEDVSKLMNKETWLTANEAKSKGLISKVTGEASFQNKIEMEDWPYMDKSILNTYNKSVKLPEQNQFEDMKKFFSDLKNQILNGLKDLKLNANETENTQLMDSIAEAVSKPFTGMEEALNAHVAEIIKNYDFKPVIAEMIKNLATKEEVVNKTDFEALRDDVVAKIGKPSKSEKEEGIKAVGNFN